MAKGPDAFRTISEVAEWLDVPTHVLRFWESRFTQVKPVKRAGGRRYYRPADMQLLGGIKRLLHDEGLTIRGVQKLLREEGVRHVAALSPPTEGETQEQGSANVITLNPARSAMDEDSDHWLASDEPEDAVETLAAYLDDADADAMDAPDDAMADADEPPARADASHADRTDATHEAPTHTLPELAAADPFLDEDALELRPLVIAPLAAMGRKARAQQARALSAALIEAEILAHAWDARL